MRVKQTLIFQALGDDTVIVPMDEAAEALHGMLRVNASAAAIIRSLADGLDEEAAAARLLTGFDGVDMDEARKAVRDIADKLRAAGLTEDEI